MLRFAQTQIAFGKHYQLYIEDFSLRHLKHTVVVGANGSGKSAFTAAMASEGDVVSGTRMLTPSTGWVSVAQQQALIESERQKDSADILDIIAVPSTVEEVIFRVVEQTPESRQQLHELSQLLNATYLLQRDFIALSTGETRKVLLLREILKKPDLLILDEPWDGLDTSTCQSLNAIFRDLHHTTTLVFVVNRLDEVPDYIQHWVYLEHGSLAWQSGSTESNGQDLQYVKQLLHIRKSDLQLPAIPIDRHIPASGNGPLVVLKNGHVEYGDVHVFKKLDWCINPGEHWQVVGPNGSGKTCLLNLITGDNPLCYRNDLEVFGYRRGSGESIWDIKKHIGFISNALHLAYRVNCSLLHVILSGFYDSIGLYQTPTDSQYLLAKEWLEVIGMAEAASTAFQELSFGDQRMALIARAMVKYPALLILDEPTNGLDEINRLKVLALIELLAKQGTTTILYVNHHAQDIIPGIEAILDMQNYR